MTTGSFPPSDRSGQQRTRLRVQLTVPRPTSDDPEEWAQYWRMQGQPWRRAKEIEFEQKKRLQYYLNHPIVAEDGTPLPFARTSLTRADVEWLRYRWLKRGKKGELNLRGAKLPREDNWREVDLSEAHLEWLEAWGGFDFTDANFSNAHLEGANLSNASLRGTTMRCTHLDRSDLVMADLSGAELHSAELRRAELFQANFEGATLFGATLQEADLSFAHLESANLNVADLTGADLTGAFLNARTDLRYATLGNGRDSFAKVGKVRWGGVDLSEVDWKAMTVVGEEWAAHQAVINGATETEGDLRAIRHCIRRLKALYGASPNTTEELLTLVRQRVAIEDEIHQSREAIQKRWQKELDLHEAALRATRQLASALGSQGLNEERMYFAYRAHQLRRSVLRYQAGLRAIQVRLQLWWWQPLSSSVARPEPQLHTAPVASEWKGQAALSYFGSLFLDRVAGYGYWPRRAVITYVFTVMFFAALFWFATHNLSTASYRLQWYEAVVLSIYSFHGRGFVPSYSETRQHVTYSLSDPVGIIAATEAVVGLLVEISFIAAFTRRFFEQ